MKVQKTLGEAKMNNKILLLIMAVCLLSAVQTQAIVLTFDDISTTGQASVPNGYGSLNWNLFFYTNTPEMIPDSGFNNGRVSGEYVAIVSDYSEPGIGRITGELFSFEGAYLTAGWNDGLSVQVDGYLEDGLIYTTTVTINTIGPTWCEFNYTNIDELRFSSYGGTVHEGYPDNGEYFCMDNFTYTPEPGTLLLFVFGAVLLRKRQS